MSQETQSRFFNPSCPSGSKFYACETGTNFVGCCTRDACTSVGCSAGNLKPASFDKAFYGKFPDQQCPSGSQWYTCAYTDPPFMGCCKSGPCTKGCAPADLTAGFLDSNPDVAAPFLSSSRPSTKSTARSTASATASPRSSSSSTVSSSSAISSPTAGALPENPTASSTSKQVSPGAIAGGVVGGVAFVAFLILIAVVVVFRRRKAAATSAPVEKDGKIWPSEHYNGVAHPYDRNEIHEAPGGDGITRDVKDLSRPGSSYPSPTPAYSPGKYGTPPGPPGHPAISELDSPGTPFLRHHESHPSFELPVVSGRAHSPGSPVRSGMSAEGLGINLTSPSHRSPGATTAGGHPSPLSLNSARNDPMLERGSRWDYRE